MAKRVSVAELQAMSRGAAIDETEIIDPATEDAAATEALRRIGAPVDGKGQGDDGTIGTPCTACRAYDHVDRPRRMVDGINGVRYQVCDWCDEHGRQADGSLLKAEPIAVTSGHADGVDALIEATADGRVGEISVTPADGINEPLIDTFEPSIYDHLRALGVERGCTAEMSLHMITERVRDAALTLPAYYAPTETDVVHEAERIWVSLDRKRSHTYSVEQDGTIRDWRRPDTTPDRGDVTQHQTLTDAYAAGDQRFSGGGDGQVADTYPVPTDQQFNGKLYRDAPDLANRAESLIERHGFLSDLVNCEIRYFWKRKTGVSKGRVKIGYCKRASDLLGHFTGADFIVWLSATTARDGKFTDTQVEAALFHQLLHIGTDDSGNFIFAPHDFEGFGAEIRHYGTWTEDLKLGGTAFVAAHQMGLFTDEDEGIDDEDDGEGEAAEQAYFDAAGEAMERDLASDGDGTLIHDDGTPMTADEIEAMERHELEDAPAEDEDILADPAVI